MDWSIQTGKWWTSKNKNNNYYCHKRTLPCYHTAIPVPEPKSSKVSGLKSGSHRLIWEKKKAKWKGLFRIDQSTEHRNVCFLCLLRYLVKYSKCGTITGRYSTGCIGCRFPFIVPVEVEGKDPLWTTFIWSQKEHKKEETGCLCSQVYVNYHLKIKIAKELFCIIWHSWQFRTITRARGKSGWRSKTSITPSTSTTNDECGLSSSRS